MYGSKNIIKSFLALLCTSAIFMLAPSAGAVGIDDIYIKNSSDDIEVHEVEELDAQAEEFIYGTTSSLYDYDHMLPSYSVNSSICKDAKSIKEVLCDNYEKYIPTLDENGNFRGYTDVSTENGSNEVIAFHEGGIYNFVYSEMTKTAENEVGTSFDEVYFVSDAMFSGEIGLLMIKDGTETYFDVSAYYSIKNVTENYNDGKYLYTTEEFLNAQAHNYEMLLAIDGESGDGLSEYENTVEEIGSAAGAYEESKISSADNFGFESVILSLAILTFIGSAVKCAAKK